MKGAGYATFFAGKWHLGPEGFWPENQGFDHNLGGNERGGPYGGDRYFSPYGNSRLPDGPPGEHLPDRLATETAGGSEEVANRRLGEIVKDGIKGVIARRTIQQVVAADRSEFLGEVVKIAGSNVSELGIILIDVRVKSIDLPEEVSESVFNRMRQDFARQAAQLRGEGSAVSEQTRAEAERQRTEILAGAYRTAEIVRGEGDAAAADIYARAYGRNPEFYSFYRGLQAYRRSLGKQGDILVITPQGEFFKYLKDAGP
jgi:membrane protease subunit HflC